MNAFLKLVSALGLVLTVGPSFLVFAGLLSWQTHALLMLAGTVLWFASAPFWMHRPPRPSAPPRGGRHP